MKAVFEQSTGVIKIIPTRQADKDMLEKVFNLKNEGDSTTLVRRNGKAIPSDPSPFNLISAPVDLGAINKAKVEKKEAESDFNTSETKKTTKKES